MLHWVTFNLWLQVINATVASSTMRIKLLKSSVAKVHCPFWKWIDQRGAGMMAAHTKFT